MSKLKDIFIRMRQPLVHPFGSMLFMVALVFIGLILSDINFGTTGANTAILAFIGVASLLVVLTIMARTKYDEWTMLNSGLVGMFFGITLNFAFQWYYVYHPDDFEHFNDLVHLIRALFVVCSIWTVIGLFIDWWYTSRMSVHRMKKLVRQNYHFIRTKIRLKFKKTEKGDKA